MSWDHDTNINGEPYLISNTCDKCGQEWEMSSHIPYYGDTCQTCRRKARNAAALAIKVENERKAD